MNEQHYEPTGATQMNEQQKAEIIGLAKMCLACLFCAASARSDRSEEYSREYASEYSAEAFRIAQQGG